MENIYLKKYSNYKLKYLILKKILQSGGGNLTSKPLALFNTLISKSPYNKPFFLSLRPRGENKNKNIIEIIDEKIQNISDTEEKYKPDLIKMRNIINNFRTNELILKLDRYVNFKYIEWLTNKVVRDELKLEDLDEDYINNLIKYDQLSKKEKGIKKISEISDYKEIQMAVLDSKIDLTLLLQIKQIDTEKNLHSIIDNEYFSIYIANTKAESCVLGRKTKWCTAAQSSENLFDSYNYSGPLFIINPKEPGYNGEKYQIHLNIDRFDGNFFDESLSIMNELDEELKFSEIISRFEDSRIKEYFKNNTEMIEDSDKMRIITKNYLLFEYFLIIPNIDLDKAIKKLVDADKIKVIGFEKNYNKEINFNLLQTEELNLQKILLPDNVSNLILPTGNNIFTSLKILRLGNNYEEIHLDGKYFPNLENIILTTFYDTKLKLTNLNNLINIKLVAVGFDSEMHLENLPKLKELLLNETRFNKNIIFRGEIQLEKLEMSYSFNKKFDFKELKNLKILNFGRRFNNDINFDNLTSLKELYFDFHSEYKKDIELDKLPNLEVLELSSDSNNDNIEFFKNGFMNGGKLKKFTGNIPNSKIDFSKIKNIENLNINNDSFDKDLIFNNSDGSPIMENLKELKLFIRNFNKDISINNYKNLTTFNLFSINFNSKIDLNNLVKLKDLQIDCKIFNNILDIRNLNNLETLILKSERFNNKLNIEGIINLKEITIKSDNFNQEIDTSNLKELEIIELGKSFNHQLNLSNLTKLKKLEIGNIDDNKEIKNYFDQDMDISKLENLEIFKIYNSNYSKTLKITTSSKLKSLTIYCNLKEKLVLNNLKNFYNLEIGGSFNQPIDLIDLPNLEYFTITDEYSDPLNILTYIYPKSLFDKELTLKNLNKLRSLELNNSFNSNINLSELPKLYKIILGEKFNKPLFKEGDYKPPELYSFEIKELNSEFNQDIDFSNFKELRKICIYGNFNSNINLVNTDLEILKLGNKFNKKIDYFPSTLNTLKLGNSYKQDIQLTLSNSLVHIQIESEFNNNLDITNISSNSSIDEINTLSVYFHHLESNQK